MWTWPVTGQGRSLNSQKQNVYNPHFMSVIQQKNWGVLLLTGIPVAQPFRCHTSSHPWKRLKERQMFPLPNPHSLHLYLPSLLPSQCQPGMEKVQGTCAQSSIKARMIPHLRLLAWGPSESKCRTTKHKCILFLLALSPVIPSAA